MKLKPAISFIIIGCIMLFSFSKEKSEDSRMIINEICELIETHYILKENIPTITDSLRYYQDKGEYNVSDGKELAKKLTADLKEFSEDKHFRLRCSSARVKAYGSKSKEGLSNRLQDQWKEIESKTNYGFVKTEILEGNIGYIKINEFTVPSYTEPILVNELQKLKGVDGIIFDLSDCIGGSGVMVRRVISYLRPKGEKLHLLTIECSEEKPIKIYPDKKLIGERMLNIPISVIISPRTYSAGEVFSYTLQQHNLATIYGQRSKGGAHGCKEYPINDSLIIQIPRCRPIHPITNSNWEGIGVEPDVYCHEDSVLELCRQRLIK